MSDRNKDLYKAIKYECIMISRLGDCLADRNDMWDFVDEANLMIKEAYEDGEISNTIKKFLLQRVRHTALIQRSF